MDDDDVRDAGATPPAPRSTALREDSDRLLIGGATLGTFAVVTGALFGATCPMCIVVAPLMLAGGAVQRWRCARAEREDAAGDADPERAGQRAASAVTIEK